MIPFHQQRAFDIVEAVAATLKPTTTTAAGLFLSFLVSHCPLASSVSYERKRKRRPWAQTSFSSYRFPVWCAQTPLSEKYIDSDALADVMRMLTDLPDLFSTSLSCSLLLWTTTFTKPKQTDFLQLSVDKLSEGTCHRH